MIDEEVWALCRKRGVDPEQAAMVNDPTGCGYTTWGAIFGPIVGGTIPTCGKRPVVQLATESDTCWFPACAEHADYQSPEGVTRSRPIAWPVSITDAEAVADLAIAEATSQPYPISMDAWLFDVAWRNGVNDALRWSVGTHEPSQRMLDLVRRALPPS